MSAAFFPDNTRRTSRTRLALVGALFLGCCLVLLWRLFTFQIRDVARYERLANEERRAEIPILAKRGSLLDTQGNPLAESVPYESVYAVGSLVGNPDRLAQTLSPILGKSADDIRAHLDPKNNSGVVLESRIPSAVSEQLRQLNLPGVYLQKEPIREYPEGSVAAQILGFIGTDSHGLGGLELSYDRELNGTAGVIDTEKDTSGEEITLGRRVLTPPQDGSDLVLTLDRYVQHTAESLLNDAVRQNKARGGLIIVMEPQTGNILAVANNPTYQLTKDDIYDPAHADLYKSKIVTDQYEPGSTMKTISMAVAIDNGVVTPDTQMMDTGSAVVAGTLIHNWDGNANGRITMTQLLIHSSNVGMQWVAGLLGADRFYEGVRAFGFGKPTGIRLPGEVSGTIRANTDPDWTRVDLATNSYGQGIAVTPLQMLTAVSSFANDGALVQPRLVREIRGPDGVQTLKPQVEGHPISASTARSLIQMMVAVGNQVDLKPDRLPGYTLAMKTGTADTPTNAGYDTAVTIGSVVSLFPAEDPRFAVLIRLDGPQALYGGIVAAPVLKQLASDILTYYRVPPNAAAEANR